MDKCQNRNNIDIRDVAKVNVYGFSFDFEDNYFAKKISNNFEIEVKNGEKFKILSSEIMNGRVSPVLYMMTDDGGARGVVIDLENSSSTNIA